MLNRVILQGRLGADPIVKQTPQGTSVVSVNIAVDRDYTPKGQEKQTDWIAITAWKGTADFIGKYFAKGDKILVEGRIQTRNYTDKDGKKVYVTEVVVDGVNFCENKKDRGDAYEPDNAYAPSEDDGNVPF